MFWLESAISLYIDGIMNALQDHRQMTPACENNAIATQRECNLITGLRTV